MLNKCLLNERKQAMRDSEGSFLHQGTLGHKTDGSPAPQGSSFTSFARFFIFVYARILLVSAEPFSEQGVLFVCFYSLCQVIN